MDYVTRTDCTRDNRKVNLPNVQMLGFWCGDAKRGRWVSFMLGEQMTYGRVVGRVTCEGKVYVEVIALLGDLCTACVRWVDPADVLTCRPRPPMQTLAFIMGEWTDPAAILKASASGHAYNFDDPEPK